MAQGFALYWNGFRSKSPHYIIGLMLIIFPLLVMLLFGLIISSFKDEPYHQYDHKKIIAAGATKQAKLVYIGVRSNVSINDQSPAVITYDYEQGGTTVTDKFETMEFDQVARMRAKDSITIAVLNGQSVIKGVEPFKFPVGLFYIVPVIFLLVGIPFLYIAHRAGMKTLRQEL